MAKKPVGNPARGGGKIGGARTLAERVRRVKGAYANARKGRGAVGGGGRRGGGGGGG